jgi:putative ATP-dependent endonuclease of OLD family
MKISRIKINNFRGIRESDLFLPDHGVFIGDNNTGKTSVLEAIDLVLGPDRLNRRTVVDEHDFYGGEYLKKEIKIEVYVTNLNEEQERHFHDQIEFWDTKVDKLYEEPNPAGVDEEYIVTALRVLFVGGYDEENDDFYGETFYSSLYTNKDSTKFYKKDKFICGFLYLRSLRTGTRALSLEKGSLLDIILRNKELQLKVWEKTISELDDITVASDPDLGVSGVLESISKSLKKYVPKEWGTSPKLKISNLTREELRKVITAFISTGVDGHSAPFYRQGTGSVNLLVLAM